MYNNYRGSRCDLWLARAWAAVPLSNLGRDDNNPGSAGLSGQLRPQHGSDSVQIATRQRPGWAAIRQRPSLGPRAGPGRNTVTVATRAGQQHGSDPTVTATRAGQQHSSDQASDSYKINISMIMFSTEQAG